MKKLDKPLYFVNSNLYHVSKVMLGVWHDELEYYWDKSDEYSCEKLGHDPKEGHASFSSYDKKDVEAYVLGQKDLRRLLKNLT